MFWVAPDGLPPPGYWAKVFSDSSVNKARNNFDIKLYFDGLDAL
jgi:hypothetical protein